MQEKTELLRSLKTREEGLTAAQVARGLEQFGPNLLEEEEAKNYLSLYLKEYFQFFAILLEVAALLSFVADYYAPDQGNDILGYAILGAVIINATFTFWQQYRADRAMAALLELMPTMVTVRRDGTITTVDAKELTPGDILILEAGDKVAADGVLVASSSLYLNLSSLTGESRPAARSQRPSSQSNPLHARNMVFAGTTVVSGSGVAVVCSIANATEFGKIASLTKHVEKKLTPMQREIVRITRILTIVALVMGLVFFLLGLFSAKGPLMASIFALSLIVANVPEGLLPTITLSLSLAGQRMAKRNALLKNLDSVETLGSASVICSDKTGTITRNEMTLRHIWLAGGEEITLSGEGYQEQGSFFFDRESSAGDARLDQLLKAALSNCTAVIEAGTIRGDPTELALVAAAHKRGLREVPAEKIREHAFTSERKMMSSVFQEEQGEFIYAKGAVEVLLDHCAAYLESDQQAKPLDQGYRRRILSRAERFEKRAYRVLAVAMGQGHREEQLTLLGLVAIMDLPRPEVAEAVALCRKAGIRTMMITGDNALTAAATAEKIGMGYDRIIVGDELEGMADERLEDILAKEDVLFARMAGHQKLRIASALQSLGEVVAMTGDGVNDAPALKKADIGIAMGRTGTEVAKEAADMILLDDNFSTIVAAIEEGRTVYFNIKKFVTYILSSNVPEIVPYVLQFFLRIPLPLSVIQILSIDLGSDLLPGLALGSERPEKNIMNRPPAGRRENILDWEVFKRGYFFIGLIEATAAMVAFVSFLLLHGWQYGTVELADPLLHRQAMTMTLLGAVSCQLVNVWTMRSWEFSAFSVGLLSNPLLIGAMVIELVWIWMLLYLEPVQEIFNTARVPLSQLWLLLPFPLLLFIGHETYKWRQRRRRAAARPQG
ncbi:cation-translocating P-type ATPase [Desulfogranum mediterraneum]|uniref:cation-translocating P-type ATPase n=1 Tax=Desulfogranum mediterraneum TaxID=160661 RepID=UPI001ABF8924|nr:cation-transporting P-type ATPase [Desulfogranum mediterraneum]